VPATIGGPEDEAADNDTSPEPAADE
jgi:hypothetical protein